MPRTAAPRSGCSTPALLTASSATALPARCSLRPLAIWGSRSRQHRSGGLVMGTVHAFDPRPAKPLRAAPFFIGLGWALAFVLTFWAGTYRIAKAFHGGI